MTGARRVTTAKHASLFLALLLGPVLLLVLAGPGCNALLGIDEHGLATGDAAPAGSASGDGSDAAGDGSLNATPDGHAPSDGATSGDGAVGDGTVDAGTKDGGPDSATGPKPGADAGLDASADADAAAAPDASSGDAGADASSCDPSTPFTSYQLVGGMPGGLEIHGRLSPDETTIWFDTTGGIIYVGTRASLDAPFSYTGLGAGGAAVSFTGDDIYPTVTDDLKTIYFLNGDTNLLTEATRGDTSQLFVSDGGALPLASPPGALYRAAFVVGPTLYYGLFASGLSGSEIYFSNISGQTLSAPQVVSGFPLSGAGGTGGVDGERFPVASHDGLTMYFRDAVFIDSGVGQVGEIFVSQRAHASDPFVTWRVVEELNTELGEEPLWLSFDQCRLYFMSFRDPEGLYVASH